MIPSVGKQEIGRSLSNNLGSHIAVGIGGTAPAIGDRNLQFEVWRGEITARAYDPATSKLHFKTNIPDVLDLTVVEVALIVDSANEVYSTLISTADADMEDWTGGTWTGTGVRMGGAGINVSSSTATLNNVRANLSSYGSRDQIQLAYHAPTGGGTVTLTLYTTPTDYYRGAFTAVAGYNIATFTLQGMTATGSPDLSNIEDLTLQHSGAGSVTMDAVRAVRTEFNSTLVQRSVITPRVKSAGVPMDIEVSITI